MLYYGKKIRVLRDKKNILTLVLSEKKILNETKNHNLPCKLNGRSLSNVLHTGHGRCTLYVNTIIPAFKLAVNDFLCKYSIKQFSPPCL